MGNALNKKNEEYYNFQTSIVVAVIDDKEQAQTAYAALTRASFADDAVELFHGLKGERDLDLKGEHHGRLQQIMRKIQNMLVTTEGLQMDYYERELMTGSTVLRVQTDFHNQEQAHKILKSNGARYINSYGILTNKVLEQ